MKKPTPERKGPLKDILGKLDPPSETWVSPVVKIYGRTVQERNEEVNELKKTLTPEEIDEGLTHVACKKWYRLQRPNSDFKPESKGEENK